MKATFDDERFGYSIDGESVDLLTAKGASAGIAREAKANLSILIQRLQNEQSSLQEADDGFKRETKMLHMAEHALAHGGVDQVKDWAPVEAIVAEQWNGNEDFPGLCRFFEDIQNGRYGTQTLSSGVLSRGLQYANAGRATYENERLAAQMRLRDLEAKRVTGAPETHCDDCPAWARLGWIEAAVMYERYAIGMSSCNVACYCVIVTRRAAIDAAQAVGWRALLPLLQSAARVAGSGAAIAGALALFRYAGNNPRAVSFALELLMRVLETRRA
ncbi:MAG: hypothetical protein KY445_08515 [Armatimonadetes bacterium]|nr:hypothetical protein [Armatimonadota bacterium]